MKEFKNEPAIDWSEIRYIAAMRAALQKVRAELGQHYPLLVAGSKIYTSKSIFSVNPANFNEVVGVVSKVDQQFVDLVVQQAEEALPEWARLSSNAEYLFRAAEITREKKFELMAWIVMEAGKNWQEAAVELEEAIDFLEIYGTLAGRLSGRSLTQVQVPGEINQYCYSPIGVAAVIGIWNFPLALNLGMCAARLAARNTVVFKPAPDAPVIGCKIEEIFREAGLPPGVFSCLPAEDEDRIGPYLVRHPGIDLIGFTGSKETALKIIRTAAQNPPKRNLKKEVVAETGGKGFTIVDQDADIDEAVKACLAGAFSFQGQKCSANTRTIVLERIHDLFLKRLVEATKSLPIASPEEPGATQIGPLINKGALAKVKRYIELGKNEAELVLEVRVPKELHQTGYYQGPVIFAGVNPKARIAQEEIFGPVLVVLKARDFKEAIEIANDSEFGLTGSVFTRNRRHIEMAKKELKVGVLYINKKTTGSIVGRQPFGGIKKSGSGYPSGTIEHFLQFVQMRVFSEDIRTKGSAPLE